MTSLTDKIFGKSHKEKMFSTALLGVICAGFLYACTPRPQPLDSTEWGVWDAGMYSDARYPMTLWLFKVNWFDGKTKADVVRELPERGLAAIEGDNVAYPVRFTDGFMERWDIDYAQRNLGILTLYFEEDTLVRAEYTERPEVGAPYSVKKTWSH